MSRFQTKGYPWSHGIGTDVTDCTTWRECMEKAALNFHVEKCNLVAKMPFNLKTNNYLSEDSFAYGGNVYRELDGAYATYRTDLDIPLGLVKQRYEVIQNEDAFSFFDDAIGKDKAQWQDAGYFGQGHKIFITAKLPTTIEVNGKDPIENYLVFSNSHDGSSSINIMFTPIRVFCTNCLNSALRSADSCIRIKHTRTAKERLEQSSRILKIACEYAETTKLLYDSLAAVSVSDQKVQEYICRLILSDDELINVYQHGGNNPWEKAISGNWYVKNKADLSTRKINQLANIWTYYLDGPGQDRILGTAWGAYNSITGYYSNVANLEGSKRMDSLIWGNGNAVMLKALNAAVELAEAV